MSSDIHLYVGKITNNTSNIQGGQHKTTSLSIKYEVKIKDNLAKAARLLQVILE